MVATHTLAREAVSPADAEMGDDGGVVVTWGDGHVSLYSAGELPAVFGSNRVAARQPMPEGVGISRSGGSPAAGDIPLEQLVASGALEIDAGLGQEQYTEQVLDNLAAYGLAFVTGVEPSAAATRALLEGICFARATHYGDFWDFTADLEHGDTAYTNLALRPHTDGTYFTDPPGAQILHCLEHDGSGGDSVMVDGFAALDALAAARPDHFDLLSSTPLRWTYVDANDVYSAVAPAVTTDAAGALRQLRFNNDDRDGFPDGDASTVAAYYEAWTHLMGLVNDANAPWTATFKLLPGTVCFFDNWRTLHGRTAFTGKRRLAGAYYSAQDLASRHARIKRA
ncbi:trimethyllysine dioxygenase [Thecamonas trahens ATCC 50062]|uniref:Trimethyllysine dioxygenase n=1 Tax=Thecamonas trahens ATCC 50062 TaxID=461836 RepID=A0A0L0DRY2_THETB|nr:trimethyllysine dioxygenase [Thecamonas trahens ATCC 50062]KNC54796.1 trimethyllysine dioxygenase [Thecamonas trahens ATCC 50062]|eukprot:XP_013761696.1 trimethyllysine dioxygenase [Thecamonas trahens ATCC 50062]